MKKFSAKFINHKQTCNPTFLLLLLFMLALPRLHAQSTTTFFEEWAESGGGGPTQVQNELLERIATVTDGSSNLFVASSTFNGTTDVYDLLLQKFNSSGTLIWSNQFNISGGGDVLVGDLVLDGSGYPIVTGAVLNSTNSFDALTVKYTTSGTVSWNQTWNGNANGYDGGTSVTTDGSGNIYVAGMATATSTYQNFLTIKYTSGGTQSWAVQYDNAGLADIGVKVVEGSGIVKVFGTAQVNSTSYIVARVGYYASTGTLVAVSVLSDTIVFNEINGFTTDASGNTYIVGAKYNDAVGLDFLTIKVDDNLDLAWSATWDGSGEKDVAEAVDVDASGNVFVTGYTKTTSNGTDYMTLKYNSSGTLQWSEGYDGAAELDDQATDIAVDGDGNIFVTGFAQEEGTEDFVTIWYDTDGDELWKGQFNSIYNRKDRAAVLHLDGDDAFFVSGKTVMVDVALDESLVTTTVRYRKTDLIIPPDEEEQSRVISFVKNNGQLIDDDGFPFDQVRFYSESSPAMYFFDDRVAFLLSRVDEDTSTQDTLIRVDMAFEGSNVKEDLKIFSYDELSQYQNFFLSNIPQGRSRVPMFSRLVHSEPYPFIDVQYYSNNFGTKYYINVKPGGDPTDIVLSFDGQDSLSLDSSGNLVLETILGNIVMPRPIAVQFDTLGNPDTLNWEPAYLINGNEVSLQTGGYNTDIPVVIIIRNEREPKNYAGCGDDWVTYYGGNQPDRGKAIDVDGGGIYVLGETGTKMLPTSNGPLFPYSGETDAFIVKFDGDYAPLWTTYFGGSKKENAMDISFNSTGDVYIVGFTISTNLPETSGTTLNGYNDAFAARFNKEGTALKWSSYLGGNSRDFGLGIAVNGSNHAFIVGNTESNGQFPYHEKTGAYNQEFINNVTSGGATDAFILEFDEANVQQWGTYFGGELSEVFADIEIGSNGDIFLLGNTNTPANAAQTTPCDVPTAGSGEFPDCVPGGVFNVAYAGAYLNSPANEGDLILVQFGSNGVLKWSTYLGSNRAEKVWGPQIDDIKTGKIVIDPSNPNNFAIVGASNNVSLFPYHVQNGYSQQNVGTSPLLIKFEDRLISWSTGFTCGTTEPVSIYGLTYGEGGELYFSANTLCNAPQTDPDFFCKEPTNGTFFPICPPSNAFFQDDDVNDCDVEDAVHRGGTELYVVCFNPANELIYSTYFGGSGGEVNGGLGFSGKTLFLTGFTASAANFPLIDPGDPAYFQQDIGVGSQDAFIAGLDMENVFSTTNATEKIGALPAKVEPNPTSGQTFLVIDHSNAHVDIRIYDSTGKIVQDSYETIVDGRLRLDLSTLTPGLYFVQVIGNGKLYNAKIIRH